MFICLALVSSASTNLGLFILSIMYLLKQLPSQQPYQDQPPSQNPVPIQNVAQPFLPAVQKSVAATSLTPNTRHNVSKTPIEYTPKSISSTLNF